MAQQKPSIHSADASESSEDSDADSEASFSPYLSAHALPLLYTNLAGEMVYVLNTRLNATSNLNDEKRRKILCSVVDILFNQRFITEGLTTCSICPSRSQFKTIFQKLLEIVSITFGEHGLNKLYDLMVMSLKSQLYCCPRPEDYLLVTVNHLDGIEQAVGSNPATVKVLDNMYNVILKANRDLTSGQFIVVRQLLLNCFRDVKAKVSVLMKEGLQNESGLVIEHGGGHVPFGFEPPGVVRYFVEDGKTPACPDGHFAVDYRYEPSLPAPSLERHNHHGTKLGVNLYSSSAGKAKATSTTPTVPIPDASSKNEKGPVDSMVDQKTKEKMLRHAKAEDQLMRKALGEKGSLQGIKKPAFDLDMELGLVAADSPKASKKPAEAAAASVPTTVADYSKGSHKAYESIWKEFTFQDEGSDTAGGGPVLTDHVQE